MKSNLLGHAEERTRSLSIGHQFNRQPNHRSPFIPYEYWHELSAPLLPTVSLSPESSVLSPSLELLFSIAVDQDPILFNSMELNAGHCL